MFEVIFNNKSVVEPFYVESKGHNHCLDRRPLIKVSESTEDMHLITKCRQTKKILISFSADLYIHTKFMDD